MSSALEPLIAARTLAPLRDFVEATTRIVTEPMTEMQRIDAVREQLARLIADDAWLPDEAAVPHPQYYRQYLLHCDPFQRFSVVSFVWGPGQRTPVHDHQVWGLIGMLRGAETSQSYMRGANGALQLTGALVRLDPGDIATVSPSAIDIHQVSNAYDDRTSISIHVYGGNIGAVARHIYEPRTGEVKPFVSGYSSTQVPNLWDLSALVRAGLAEETP
jgi:predicted metal-dependent enzyme (double-stranded beta helix superfamily)